MNNRSDGQRKDFNGGGGGFQRAGGRDHQYAYAAQPPMQGQTGSSGRSDPAVAEPTWRNKVFAMQVKNTFVDVIEETQEEPSLRRSASDGHLSSSSGDRSSGVGHADRDPLFFWLPSSLSSSSGSGGQRQLQNQPQDTTPVSTAPWLKAASQGASDELIPWPNDANCPDDPDDDVVYKNGKACIMGEPSAWSASTSKGSRTLDIQGMLLAERIHHELNGVYSLEHLQALAEEGLLQQIPRADTGELGSVGSVRHVAGDCTPCAYWFKGTCKNGLMCNYCHIIHPGQKFKRLRPSKHTRMRIRRDEEKKDALLKVRDDFDLAQDAVQLPLPPPVQFDESLEGTIEHL